VRFAPSPTGSLHIGGARSALFNFLFARRYGGVFILRIEDTDATRSSREYETEIMTALRWLGLDWDEGVEKGGKYGPYRQSERREIYDEAIARLLDSGAAYPCFCTNERLDELHRQQQAAKRPPRYDGRCFNLSRDETARRVAEGEPYTVRLHVPPHGALTIDDLIRGRVEVALKNLDDFIIRRSNGEPLFILAGAVDDAAMKITHVLRGEDHLTNTHKQVLVHQALGNAPPRFGHLPMVVGDDGKPLSKRLGDLGVLALRDQGYCPDVLAAHLARLGWAATPEADTLATLAAAFEVDRVAKKPARIGLDDLRHRQARWIRQASPAALTEAVAPFAPEIDRTRLDTLVRLFAEEAENLADLAARARSLLADPPLPDDWAETVRAPAMRALLEAVQQKLAGLERLDEESAREIIRQASADSGVQGRALYNLLRIPLSGQTHGPDLAALMAALGAPTAAARLQRALAV
jgi:glutamyl-tRNA synthetase